MRLEQLTLKIEAAGLATRGVDLFQQFMPATVEHGIVLLPSLAGSPINWQLPGWQKANNFQLLVRHASIKVGYDLIQNVSNAITSLTYETLPAIPPDIPAINTLYVRPKHDIVILPRSPSNYFEFSQNFEVTYATVI